MHFEGVFPILPTPFGEDERIDPDGLARIVRFVAELGVQGVTVLGVLGEANRLTDAERATLIGTAVAAAGRLPVVVGASHAGTFAAARLCEQAESLGAAAVMLTPHAEPVHSEARIFDHLAAVAGATSLPVVLQDHPGSTGVDMSADLVLRLVDEVGSIACIKQEALPSPPRVAALVDALPRRVPILTGLGGLYGAFELAAGADGFMTGFAFPEVLLAMVDAHRAGDVRRLWAVYQRFLPLIVFESQPGVAVRKAIFARRGLIDSARVRAPGAALGAAARRGLDDVLERVLGATDPAGPLPASLLRG